MARPRKLSKDIVDKLVQALALGATYDLACRYAGIERTTFYKWMKRGEAGEDAQFVNLFNAIKDIEARAALGWLAKIEEAARDGSWQAAAWKLERRYPQEYGRRSVEVSGPNGGPLKFSQADYDAAQQELDAWRRQITERTSNILNAPETSPTLSTPMD